MNKNTILISALVLFREIDGKVQWFVAKENEEDGFELPKTIVRKGESSVRASIRVASMKGPMSARVLEEVGRSSSATTVNGKSVTRKYLYYLMYVRLAPQEIMGFMDSAWLEYARAIKKLSSKADKDMLKNALETLKTWKKTHVGKSLDEDDQLEKPPEDIPEEENIEPTVEEAND